MTTRVYAPIGGAKTEINGKTFTAAEGASLNVDDDVAFMLVANGWTLGMLVGTTAQRPKFLAYPESGQTVVKKNMLYLDTTLAYVVLFDGKTWRNPATGASV